MTISEAEFQRQVVHLARMSGHRCYHTFDSRRSEPGFPDLFIIRRGMEKPLMVELKTEKGRLSAAQAEWGGILSSCPGVDYVVWRPSQWDEIQEALTKRRKA